MTVSFPGFGPRGGAAGSDAGFYLRGTDLCRASGIRFPILTGAPN
jgi:hypothetical protein